MKFTEWLAVYGALVSTATFMWNVRRANPTVRVRLIYSVEGVDIAVQNPSGHPVHVSDIDLVYPYRTASLWDRVEHMVKYLRWPRHVGWCHTSLSYFGIDTRCPVTIDPGKSHRIELPHEAIEKMLEKASARMFIASAQDELWRNKYSAPFEYPVTNRRVGDP